MIVGRHNWFWAVWGIAALAAIVLYYRWHVARDFIGIVEMKIHMVGAQEPGKIRSLTIKVGDRVEPGQVLGAIDTSDLETELSLLKGELAGWERLMQADRRRFSLEFELMRLQAENEASDLVERFSTLEAKSTELNGLNAEIERLRSAESAGLGHTRDLADLIVKRDVLVSYLKILKRELEAERGKLSRVRRSKEVFKTTDNDSILDSMLARRMERMDELNRAVALVENRMRLRTVFSPCEGRVVEIFARPGDVVADFTPIVSIEESSADYMDVYLPEQLDIDVEVGVPVEIVPNRPGTADTSGTVVFLHPGFTPIPERLAVRGLIYWARKVRVKLHEGHKLFPGEAVNVRIASARTQADLSPSPARAAEGDSLKEKAGDRASLDPQPIAVPKTLADRSRFEPSAIAWLADIGRYVIISDDTGLKADKTDHAPWLFLMDAEGRVEPEPIRLSGIDEINDLEAVAPKGEGLIYLVSSQNRSRRGRRPKSREMILEVRRRGRQFSVTGKVPLLSVLLKSYSKQQRTALGLLELDGDGRPVLNIEGAAWRDDVLYLGLKQPVAAEGAIIWRLKNPSRLFSSQELSPGQLSVFGHVDLGRHEGRAAGISDLSFDEAGKLWVLSTIPGVSNAGQLGGFHRIDPSAGGRLKAHRVSTFSGRKPEGLVSLGNGRFTIVFDADDGPSSYLHVDMGSP